MVLLCFRKKMKTGTTLHACNLVKPLLVKILQKLLLLRDQLCWGRHFRKHSVLTAKHKWRSYIVQNTIEDLLSIFSTPLKTRKINIMQDQPLCLIVYVILNTKMNLIRNLNQFRWKVRQLQIRMKSCFNCCKKLHLRECFGDSLITWLTLQVVSIFALETKRLNKHL